jgi:L-amino acid N-acyltransferase YncA
VEVVSDSAKALEIISTYYKGPVKYARAVLERWPRSGAVVAYMGGEVVGAEIFYAVDLAAAACVHYYVAVVPEYRRRGVASFLVKKVEELCGAGVYMATTTENNVAAIRLFRRLGYAEYRWGELPRGAREVLLKATCGYDDDVLLIKGGDPLAIAARAQDVERLWRETCLKPFLNS